MAERETILSMQGITKVFGSGERAVTALDNVSLEANAGEVVLVMGPSGSGKTTLLAIAGALLRPTRGIVRVCDIDTTKMSESELASIRRERVAFIYQSFNLLEALTALENVALVTTGRLMDGATSQSRAKELLEMLGLSRRLNSLPKHLSDGEKQRVAIARALAKDPALMLADEPSANLDAKRGHEVMELLRQKALEANKAVIIVSHDHRIRDVADRVVWLEDGRLRHEF
ncbi:MAG: ABC transporter ATP-binding protein [Dehalococcoidia bacterium]|nr:ABC transporter ATP-binding protein [Dehalococcoidia bacterium]